MTMAGRRLLFLAQLAFTVLVAAFLIVPALQSMLAGVTVNYFRGVRSGLTLEWIAEVWRLYAPTIGLSFQIAFATLAATLAIGIPAAYALHVRGGRLSRLVEEMITFFNIAGAMIYVDEAPRSACCSPMATLATSGAHGCSSSPATWCSRCPSWCVR